MIFSSISHYSYFYWSEIPFLNHDRRFQGLLPSEFVSTLTTGVYNDSDLPSAFIMSLTIGVFKDSHNQLVRTLQSAFMRTLTIGVYKALNVRAFGAQVGSPPV